MPSKYEAVKAWRKLNPERVAAQSRRRRERKRAHLYAQQKAWRMRNITHAREMEAAAARRRRAANPAGNKRRMERYRQKQEALLVLIAGRPRPTQCEMCQTNGKTVFDHDHVTGQFRGWLCDRCNRTLGQVKDDQGLLLQMVAYLRTGGVKYGPTLVCAAKELA